MRLRIVALGHRMPGWVEAGFDDYAKRLPREWKLDVAELKPEPRDLAAHLRGWQEDGHDVAFVIGSADGLHADIKAHAAAVVSLSAMTLPHGLARVILVEQIYRAATLLTGHPYHRD